VHRRRKRLHGANYLSDQPSEFTTPERIIQNGNNVLASLCRPLLLPLSSLSLGLHFTRHQGERIERRAQREERTHFTRATGAVHGKPARGSPVGSRLICPR
jgi:hypothetical protein